MSQIPYVFLNCLRCQRDENELGEENLSCILAINGSMRC